MLVVLVGKQSFELTHLASTGNHSEGSAGFRSHSLRYGSIGGKPESGPSLLSIQASPDLFISQRTKSRSGGLPFITSTSIVVANQNVVLADLFEATVVWFFVDHRVPVVAGPSGCDSLLGMELLKGCRIDLDRQAQAVRIERL